MSCNLHEGPLLGDLPLKVCQVYHDMSHGRREQQPEDFTLPPPFLPGNTAVSHRPIPHDAHNLAKPMPGSPWHRRRDKEASTSRSATHR